MTARKALLIGIDGLLFRKVASVAAPTLQRLASTAVFAESRIYPDGTTKTVSGPGWSTIVTGTWPEKHGVQDNDFVDHRLSSYPDLLTRATREGLTTFVVAAWKPITSTVISDEVSVRHDFSEAVDWAEADRAAVDRATPLLAGDVDLAFVYLGQVDEVGHASGAASAEYAAAVESADANVARVIAAVEARPEYADEEWLVVITTDHGHTPVGGHGGQSDDERSTFVLTYGASVAAEARIELVDIAPTMLSHLGVAIDERWELDGRSVLEGVRE
ncbi:alkaline phosphatase family protein [Tenggerimyces flavus]|uniref:Alkaline phosphatase family protein n=1 Tax=Tenggerimyces flavus TaxID=1708749 RepID=A0ABV7YGD7_9ACTN|nr:alkaline phosphatase family protein [Tenggerimyces flavus]MBM7791329.1 putative AlkP superfamily pyrophosphatase or phosphodiesterase [Tenggerimyces flavus]